MGRKVSSTVRCASEDLAKRARFARDQGVRENLSVAQQDIALQGGVQTEPYLVVVILLAAGQSTCVAVGLS